MPESARNEEQVRVLVVDDDPHIRRMTERFLKHAGFSVETATDGEDALSQFCPQKFDAVVSDVWMPRLGGTELLRCLRERSYSVPVILMTAEPTARGARVAEEHGVHRFLTKPIDSGELAELVAQAVRGYRAALALAAAL